MSQSCLKVFSKYVSKFFEVVQELSLSCVKFISKMCKSCKNWVTVLAKFCQGCFKVYQSWLNFLGCAQSKTFDYELIPLQIWLFPNASEYMCIFGFKYIQIWIAHGKKIWMANPSFNTMTVAWVNAALLTWVLSGKIERKYLKGQLTLQRAATTSGYGW